MSMGRPRFDPRQPQRQFQIRVNHRIRVPEVRVIDANGEMLGVLSTHEALKCAQEQGLDLVEVNPKAEPPVCKILDFSKYEVGPEVTRTTRFRVIGIAHRSIRIAGDETRERYTWEEYVLHAPSEGLRWLVAS